MPGNSIHLILVYMKSLLSLLLLGVISLPAVGQDKAAASPLSFKTKSCWP